MPGHISHPPTTYVHQLIQPLLYAKIDKVSSNSDIIFNTNHLLVSLEHPNAEVFETLHIQKNHKHCCRLINIWSHVLHLQSLQKEISDNIDELSPSFTIDNCTQNFIDLIQNCGVELDSAAKFESGLVRGINPNAGKVDFFCVSNCPIPRDLA